MSTNTTESKIVWFENAPTGLEYNEETISGGLDPAVQQARVLVKEKDILMGQILASDGLVMVNFTGCDESLKKFAN